MNEENKMSRRQAVAGLGAALASVAVSPAFAATGATGKSADGAPKISDPTKLYQKPPLNFSHSHGRACKANGPGTRLRRNQL